MKRKQNAIIIFSIIDIVAIIIAVFLLIGIIKIDNKKENIIEPQQVTPTIKNTQTQRELWLDNKSINNDYVGEIIFDSGLINKSFVQAKDVKDSNGDYYNFYTETGHLIKDYENYNGNDVYIWTNWKTMEYDYNIEGGSVFMDYRNELSDQNIIIYGHHFSETAGNDPNRNKAFTPIEKLLEQKNYENNKIVKLVLDNETRTYEFVGVYKFDVNSDFCMQNLQYYRTEYNYDEFEDIRDDDYFNKYIDAFNKTKLYETDSELKNTDKTLTLQTCISGHDGQVFEICVFKLINTEYFND